MYRQRYTPKHTEVNFLLGGIGTGCFSLTPRGAYRDFELFHSPGKGNALPYFFFALRAQAGNEAPFCRVLESELMPPYARSNGYWVHEAAGLPRFRDARMTVQLPFARVRLLEPSAPVRVTLDAFNPMIPLDYERSAIPAAELRYTVENRTGAPLRVSLMGSLENLCGAKRFQREGWQTIERDDGGVNELRREGDVSGLWAHLTRTPPTDRHFGSLALMTDEPDVSCKPEWLNRGNWDGLNDTWQDFVEDGRLEPESRYASAEMGEKRDYAIGSLCASRTLAPGEKHAFRFVFAWHFPNRDGEWYPKTGALHRVEYAARYADAWSAGLRLLREGATLARDSRRFADALYGQTLPDAVLDRVTANLAILKSPVMFRLEDGTFLSWEGCFPTEGCCEGNCSHVFTYAQALAYLYPELEWSLRRTELLLETDETGNLAFRTHQTMHDERWDFHPCVDGQLGVLMRLYRDYTLTGDIEQLRLLWPKAKLLLDFAFKRWDADGDGVLDSQQHCTYDIEFYGPNSLANTMLLGALRAAEELAHALDDGDAETSYREAFARCRARFDALMWGGRYYVQALENPNEHPYQYGRGCLSDQVFGQMLASLYGLGELIDKEHLRAALQSIYRYNFQPELRKAACVQRVYALNDEGGLLLCTWPEGGRPSQPFIYCDEVWCGVEYQVAAHLIMEGFVQEGLTLVEAVRRRYDGVRRDPFCEAECGNYYIRSLASFALLPALSGCQINVPKGELRFDPKVNAEDFRGFFLCGKGWGRLLQRNGKQRLQPLYGDLRGVRLVSKEDEPHVEG